MQIPYGVVTRGDDWLEHSALEFLSEADFPAELKGSAGAAPPRRQAVYDAAALAPLECQDPEYCQENGCLCKLFPTETFHCVLCIGAYDNGYQCVVYPFMCVGCCGHDNCRELWQNLVSRSGGV